jgi:hypothetical protein
MNGVSASGGDRCDRRRWHYLMGSTAAAAAVAVAAVA